MLLPLKNYTNRRVYVLGLGLSGKATLRALLAAKAEAYGCDDRIEDLATQHPKWPLLKNSEVSFQKDDVLVLSPGIPHTYPAPHPLVVKAKQAGAILRSDIDLFAEHWPHKDPIIAITGTNGKSSTASLIHFTLCILGCCAQLGGNIGRSVLELNPCQKGPVVLELSSFQLDITDALRPYVSILLPITPDHLDRYQDFKAYASSKLTLFEKTHPEGLCFYADDDPIQKAFAQKTALQLAPTFIPYALSKPLPDGFSLKAHQITEPLKNFSIPPQIWPEASHNPLSHEKFFKTSHIEPTPLTLPENLYALEGPGLIAAFGALRTLGFEGTAILSAFSKWPGLAHRYERVAVMPRSALFKTEKATDTPSKPSTHVTSKRDATQRPLFINDSKATNVESACYALQKSQNDAIFWLVGGRAKKNSHLEAFKPLLKAVHKAFVFGESAPLFEAFFKEEKIPHQVFHSLGKAIEAAFEDATRYLKIKRVGKRVLVLLAPAAASFDEFSNFEARGDFFKKTLQHLMSNAEGST